MKVFFLVFGLVMCMRVDRDMKCATCMKIAHETVKISEELDHSKQNQKIDMRGRLNSKGKREGKYFDYKFSEVFFEELFEGVCNRLMKNYTYMPNGLGGNEKDLLDVGAFLGSIEKFQSGGQNNMFGGLFANMGQNLKNEEVSQAVDKYCNEFVELNEKYLIKKIKQGVTNTTLQSKMCTRLCHLRDKRWKVLQEEQKKKAQIEEEEKKKRINETRSGVNTTWERVKEADCEQYEDEWHAPDTKVSRRECTHSVRFHRLQQPLDEYCAKPWAMKYCRRACCLATHDQAEEKRQLEERRADLLAKGQDPEEVFAEEQLATEIKQKRDAAVMYDKFEEEHTQKKRGGKKRGLGRQELTIGQGQEEEEQEAEEVKGLVGEKLEEHTQQNPIRKAFDEEDKAKEKEEERKKKKEAEAKVEQEQERLREAEERKAGEAMGQVFEEPVSTASKMVEEGDIVLDDEEKAEGEEKGPEKEGGRASAGKADTSSSQSGSSQQPSASTSTGQTEGAAEGKGQHSEL
mmetsp:Transcript_42846/g.83975  ORF Transcript_42846/g.83975 Transcript_42846/m.83975 type:complete len:516 (+) Transcript_42846:26-1573(+)|eukprot:CAMPEP_0175124032 /NCGR_PEP_ID=MMETSP0087-20121206/2561_1 /TAXON_ID=136419 /ORGANISM="Unknown Unknown, Strain D1" /LENGTH=515 /DNA_ID=CAMNT_0016405765 /DNA_START=8 /DNA_END=1555 /DNA_ORIENTATION=+